MQANVGCSHGGCVAAQSPIDRPNDWDGRVADTRGWILGQPRLAKRIVLLLNDLLLLGLAVWLAFSLRWGRPYVPADVTLWLVLLSAPVIGLGTFHTLGLYRLVTRFIGRRGAWQIFLATCLAVLLWGLLVLMVIGTGDPRLVVPRSSIALYGLFAFVLVWSSREIAAYLLIGQARTNHAASLDKRRVVIYGAGASGVRLLEALRREADCIPVGFIDDSPSLVGQRIGNLKVYRVAKLRRLIERDQIKEVLLALPDRQRRERREAIKALAELPVRVKTMPSMEDIASGRVAVTDLRPIDVDEVLGRDPVPPDASLLSRPIKGKSVMVTGAGGTIGGELARQILRQNPNTLVLIENSEAALYSVETEITDVLNRMSADPVVARPQVVGVLGTVLDSQLLQTTIDRYRIDTIYHAAAYKHVPIVEANPIAGLRNNTFGTVVLAEVAAKAGIERVVLISTDKAVRPTNVMGASKRLAELVFQAYAQASTGTIFSMVRFGNVLGSSGSVVQRFKQQIQEGGPVTVTHPEVIRYFMSIPEAATLVIQASAMAKGGEVFVLDMGEPVKIDELARTMIRLMGLEVQDEKNPDGDIAIKYVGLRPGEKLFEELLIDERTTATEHPRIRRNNEPSLSPKELRDALQSLQTAMETGRVEAIQAMLSRTVEGYRPDPRTNDLAAAAALAPVSRTLH